MWEQRLLCPHISNNSYVLLDNLNLGKQSGQNRSLHAMCLALDRSLHMFIIKYTLKIIKKKGLMQNEFHSQYIVRFSCFAAAPLNFALCSSPAASYNIYSFNKFFTGLKIKTVNLIVF